VLLRRTAPLIAPGTGYDPDLIPECRASLKDGVRAGDEKSGNAAVFEGWPANAICWRRFARPIETASRTRDQPARGVRRAGGAVIRHIGTHSPPHVSRLTMTTGYVAIVALSCILVVAVIALIAIEIFLHRRDK
jgi:hypothetical protein